VTLMAMRLRKQPMKSSKPAGTDIPPLSLYRQSTDAGMLPGSEAMSRRCDVTSWDDQVTLFQDACARFGSIDVVVRGSLRFSSSMTNLMLLLP
jgi:NAD(P)-dependent dehydrogenase (short-subunit alcohol dehydrogenase family)